MANTPDIEDLYYSRPDIAAEIGFLIITTSNFDMWLAPMFAKLLGNDYAGVAIVRGIESVSGKLSILFDMAAQDPDAPGAANILKHREAIEAAFALRNRLAHGLYGWKGEELGLIKGANTARRGPVGVTALVPSEIRQATERLRKATREITAGSKLYVDVPAGASPGKRAQANPKLVRHPMDRKDQPQ